MNWPGAVVRGRGSGPPVVLLVLDASRDSADAELLVARLDEYAEWDPEDCWIQACEFPVYSQYGAKVDMVRVWSVPARKFGNDIKVMRRIDLVGHITAEPLKRVRAAFLASDQASSKLKDLLRSWQEPDGDLPF